MGEKSPVREVRGISIGGKGEPYKPVVREFRERGLHVAENTIQYWRNGGRQPGRTSRRLDVSEIVAEEGAARKNEQLLRIVKTALGEREMLANNPDSFSKGYGIVNPVAEKLHVSPSVIHVVFRLTRADICLAQEVSSAVAEDFSEAVRKFQSKYPLGSRKESPLVRKLSNQKWDGNMSGFYEIFNQVGAPTVRAWLPYELEMFKDWYAYQQEQGKNKLTVFDKIILENWRKYNLGPTSKKVKSLTGVSLDEPALASHVRALEGTLLPKAG